MVQHVCAAPNEPPECGGAFIRMSCASITRRNSVLSVVNVQRLDCEREVLLKDS
jgi:hypothetical protein